MERRWVAELAEATFEVLVQEGIEDGVQAAVNVTQSDAEVHQHHSEQTAQVEAQSLRKHHDLDGCPAHHKHCHHHQDHAGDAPQVAVLLLGAREDPDIPQALDHQAVADANDGHRDEEGKEEDVGTEDGIPMTSGFWEDHDALHTCTR